MKNILIFPLCLYLKENYKQICEELCFLVEKKYIIKNNLVNYD